MNIGFFAPSYHRPQKSTTQTLFPFVKIVCKESESKEYAENGNDIVVCPDSAQGNVCRVRNWILDTFLPQYDCVVLMDDDYHGIIRTQDTNRHYLNADELEEFAESAAILCKEWGFYFWGLNPLCDKGSYREYTPFSTLQFIGGPFQAFLQGCELRYDEKLNLKEDYDMTLQNLKRYGGCLRFNFMSYRVKQAEQEGGCAMQRNTEEEKRQLNMLKIKWGGAVIGIDNTSKRGFDFNPILKTPLKGV